MLRRGTVGINIADARVLYEQQDLQLQAVPCSPTGVITCPTVSGGVREQRHVIDGDTSLQVHARLPIELEPKRLAVVDRIRSLTKQRGPLCCSRRSCETLLSLRKP